MIPQTTFVPTFWTHIVSELGGVTRTQKNEKLGNAGSFYITFLYTHKLFIVTISY